VAVRTYLRLEWGYSSLSEIVSWFLEVFFLRVFGADVDYGMNRIVKTLLILKYIIIEMFLSWS
jgi:hypothetical protein